MTRNRTRCAEILAHLEATPRGATLAELKRVFGVVKSLTTALGRLCKRGEVGYVLERNASKGRPLLRRFFAGQCCPPDAVLSAPGAPQSAPKPVVKTKAQPACLKPSDEAINRGVLPTICPRFPDRFAPAHVEPFFAAGKRLEPRSWVRAVCGSRP